MKISKLTTPELLRKLAMYEERRDGLLRIVKDITDAPAQDAMNEQLAHYKIFITQLKKELAIRNDEQGRANQ